MISKWSALCYTTTGSVQLSEWTILVSTNWNLNEQFFTYSIQYLKGQWFIESYNILVFVYPVITKYSLDVSPWSTRLSSLKIISASRRIWNWAIRPLFITKVQGLFYELKVNPKFPKTHLSTSEASIWVNRVLQFQWSYGASMAVTKL